MGRTSISGLVLVSLLAGCLAPKHVRPDAPVSADWPDAPAGYPGEPVSEAAVPAPDLGWRAFFLDPALQALVQAALDNNRDLRIAMLNVDRARSQYRIQLAEHLPDVNLDVSAPTQKQVFGPGLSSQGTIYRVGVSMPAYELDLFGRVRYQTLAALREYFATEEGGRAARISLVSEVATAWLTERSYAEQLVIAQRSVAAREASHELTVRRYQAGITSELDVRQAESLVASARATAATLARQRAQAENALVLLVGAPIGELPTPVPLQDVAIVTEIPAGLPSDLLEQRPDIRAAEQRLIEANANIGAAKAAFFPRITLTGSIGTATSALTGLFGGGAGVWSFVPALLQPIFGLAQNIAQLKVAKVDREIAIAKYEKAIQQAFRDVADALVARGPLDAQVAALTEQRAAEGRRLDLAEHRYEAGVSSYLEVLDAQRSLLTAEQALVQARQLRMTNTVDLYGALGGGLRAETGGPEAEVGTR